MGQVTDVKYLRVGQCQHLECIAAKGGRLAKVDFPSLCGLIHHSDVGWILFDTGYADHFFEATKKFPQRLYSLSLPVALSPEQKLVAQLNALGISAQDIALVVVSHYHGDHVAGLKDFPNAKFIALRSGTKEIHYFSARPLRATLQGKLPSLLPTNYFSRVQDAEIFSSIDLPKWMFPFACGFDLLGDGSLLGVSLPGHSHGQLGLFLPDASGRPVFFVADACWSLPFCRDGRLPSMLTNFLTSDIAAYRKTFANIQQLANRQSDLAILPSHCLVTWNQFNGK